MGAQKSCYNILGVDRDADEREIKRAYRKLSRKYHPDHNQDREKWAENKFKEINKAYETLKNHEPKPQVKPDSLQFNGLEDGETKTGTFTVKNLGYEADFINISDATLIFPWVKNMSFKSLDGDSELPLEVEVTVIGDGWDQDYSGSINVELNDKVAEVKVNVSTASRPRSSHNRSSTHTGGSTAGARSTSSRSSSSRSSSTSTSTASSGTGRSARTQLFSFNYNNWPTDLGTYWEQLGLVFAFVTSGLLFTGGWYTLDPREKAIYVGVGFLIFAISTYASYETNFLRNLNSLTTEVKVSSGTAVMSGWMTFFAMVAFAALVIIGALLLLGIIFWLIGEMLGDQ